MARGQTMSKQERKAIKRSRRRQLYTWGGHYSIRGMATPGKAPATKGSGDEEIRLAAVSRQIADRQEKRGFLGRRMRRLGFGK